MLHCDGKCLLMQKIREQEKNDAQQVPEMKIAKQDFVLFRYYSLIDFFSPVVNETEAYPPRVSGSPVKRSYAIFHPPCTRLS